MLPVESNPLASVIIPTYYRAHDLGNARGSVFAQSYRRFEVLVIDDGSNDDTAGVVREFPEVRYPPALAANSPRNSFDNRPT